MLSSSSLLNSGGILVGIIVGAISILFNQNEKTEMKNNADFLGLRTAAYAVSDIHKAREWYTNAFETEPYFVEDYYVGFSIGGYELGLFPEKGATPQVDNVITYWGVEDIDGVYKKLLEKGAKAGEDPTDVGDGIKVAHVFDPWGNAVGIIYNPHFKLPEPNVVAEPVVEWAPFSLKEGVTEAQLKAASKQLQSQFLVNQKGFIKRELLNKGGNEWVDLVYWATQTDAEQAMKNAEQSPACGSYFQLMDFAEVADPSEGVTHLRRVDSY